MMWARYAKRHGKKKISAYCPHADTKHVDITPPSALMYKFRTYRVYEADWLDRSSIPGDADAIEYLKSIYEQYPDEYNIHAEIITAPWEYPSLWPIKVLLVDAPVTKTDPTRVKCIYIVWCDKSGAEYMLAYMARRGGIN